MQIPIAAVSTNHSENSDQSLTTNSLQIRKLQKAHESFMQVPMKCEAGSKVGHQMIFYEGKKILLLRREISQIQGSITYVLKFLQK